ncbi:divalent metal cation transporter MntH [Abditibacteriota bacterium]|nr:divalent metal cation transporter MntH [Abditibacteriota bacterium]
MATQDIHLENVATTPSLPEAYRSVNVKQGGHWLRRFLSFVGPGYLVSVGYMDPGNWGTDLAGGAKYGYALLWVILASNLMAMLLQTLCARLGLVTGKDLAQACRDYYKKPVAIALWLLCEIAIIACDLAEVIGSAVALNLLFKIPLMWGVLITGCDVLILLGAMSFGFRKIEAIVITLVATIALCFGIEIFFAKPMWGSVATGLVPSIPNQDAFLISLGILGATVMPHNLYLHTSLVQTRNSDQSTEGKRQAIKFNTLDTIVALGAAFFVNAAILVLAGAVFHRTGHQGVEELQEAYKLLSPLMGASLASTLFAVALLASGQSSTITGTLAGQIVMEGFLKIRIKPWLRRLITRCLAIIPALFLISMSGGKNTVQLLIISQVVLSMQLSFAIFPLMMFTSDRKRMGEFVNSWPTIIIGYTVCTVIAALNVYLLYETIGAIWLGLLAVIMFGFTGWVTFFYKEKNGIPN